MDIAQLNLIYLPLFIGNLSDSFSLYLQWGAFGFILLCNIEHTNRSRVFSSSVNFCSNVYIPSFMNQFLNPISSLDQESFLKNGKICFLEHPTQSPGRLSWTLSGHGWQQQTAGWQHLLIPGQDKRAWTKPSLPYKAALPLVSIDISVSPGPPFGPAPMNPILLQERAFT